MKALEIIKAIPVQIKLLFMYSCMCYVSPSWPQTQIHTQQELYLPTLHANIEVLISHKLKVKRYSHIIPGLCVTLLPFSAFPCPASTLWNVFSYSEMIALQKIATLPSWLYYNEENCCTAAQHTHTDSQQQGMDLP